MTAPVFVDPFATQQQVADALAALDRTITSLESARERLEAEKANLDAMRLLLDAATVVVKNMEVTL